jgi:TPR repeat protein
MPTARIILSALILSFCAALPAQAQPVDTAIAPQLPSIKEYENMPPGLLAPMATAEQAAKAEAEAAKPVAEKKEAPRLSESLGDMPGIYQIPGMEKLQAQEAEHSTLSMDQVMAVYAKGKYDIALKNLEPMANNNVSSAQELLGVMYMAGQGVQKDPGKAMQLLKPAAEDGRPLAMHYLATLYFSGAAEGKPDYVSALKWVELAIIKYSEGPGKDRARKDRDKMYMAASRLEKTRATELAKGWLDARGEGYLLDLQR